MSSAERSRYSAQLTTDMIREFEKEYKGSEEERGDVKDCYVKSKGTAAGIQTCSLALLRQCSSQVKHILNFIV